MKNINVCLLAAVACTYSIQAAANSLEHNLNFVIEDNVFSLHSSSAASHTVTPLELRPMLISDTGVKLAAVCALANGGCDGLGFGKGNNDIDLDESSQCRDEGFVTSCPSGYVPDASQKCPYNNSFFKCRVCSHTCNSGALATCNSDQVETGNNKNECNETCYTCRAKTCEEGGYSSSITSCQKASNITFAGKTCYSGVSSKTCTDGGYVASIPANQVGQSTNFCGNTCYYNLRTPACSEGGHLANIPVNQVCTSVNYSGQTCYSGCYTPTCSAGGYVSSCPANQVGTSVNYYGQNCYSGCNQPTCSSGGYVDACPANQVGTAVSYSGRTCYHNCVNACTPINCSGYDLGFCPTNGTCSTCTIGCGDNGAKYKLTGCQAGYTQNGNSCTKNLTCKDGGYLNSQPLKNTCDRVDYQGLQCYNNCKRPVNIYEVWPDGSNICSSGPYISPHYKHISGNGNFSRSNCSTQNKDLTSRVLYLGTEISMRPSSHNDFTLCAVNRIAPYYTSNKVPCDRYGECKFIVENSSSGNEPDYTDVYVVFRKTNASSAMINGMNVSCDY